MTVGRKTTEIFLIRRNNYEGCMVGILGNHLLVTDELNISRSEYQ